MAKHDSALRKKIMNLIIDVYNKMDKTGENTKRIEAKFKGMKDEEFFKYMEKFVANPKANFKLEILPFKNEPDFKDIEAALKMVGSQTDEYVYFREDTSSDGKPIRSKTRVPVGYLHIKRLQQIVSKKTQVTTSIKQRNAITNQVTGDAKVARNSDVESYALITMQCNNTLKELMGPRADNQGQKRAMYNTIARDRYVRLQDVKLNDSVFEKSVLNTFDVFLMGSGIKSDLLTDGMVLVSTVKSGME